MCLNQCLFYGDIVRAFLFAGGAAVYAGRCLLFGEQFAVVIDGCLFVPEVCVVHHIPLYLRDCNGIGACVRAFTAPPAGIGQYGRCVFVEHFFVVISERFIQRRDAVVNFFERRHSHQAGGDVFVGECPFYCRPAEFGRA